MNQTIVFETERLYFREMTANDAENAYQLNIDPEVMKYVGEEPFENVDAAQKFLEKYPDYKKYGFGRWAVINKMDGGFMGWCGLKYLEADTEIDLGYRFMKKYWNQGYATEAAKACIDLGFNKFGMTEIVARAMKENIGSIRVLEKSGFIYDSESICGGEPAVLYKIRKN
jgi:ribosomal-protein-alanine N-acetyltransferase